MIVTTVVLGLVSWAVTYLTTKAESLTQSDEPLVTVSVETNPALVGAFEDKAMMGVVPVGTRSTRGPGTGCQAFHDWLISIGGVDAGDSKLQVAVQGAASQQVQINNMRVILLKREKPTPSVGLSCPSAGAANLRPITIDLDQAVPRARYQAKGRLFGFTVNKGDIETFLVTATAKKARYTWYLELDVVSQGKKATVRVDNYGKPFITAPAPESLGWSWNYSDAWYPDDGFDRSRRLAAGGPFIEPPTAASKVR
ncbi:hypothetical protein ACF1BE_29660 [Streptomyces sp. NPDC014991]|uniref:hypothetical protein n=1 Tax=Streptomyces sp. NPDC014991 TaxID=3364935 RepID=UPI0036F7B428